VSEDLVSCHTILYLLVAKVVAVCGRIQLEMLSWSAFTKMIHPSQNSAALVTTFK